MQKHNDAMKTSRHRSLEKYTSHFIERVVCERELETEQNCNILTPTLMAITAFLSRSPGLFNRGPSLSGTWSPFQDLLSNSSELQLLNQVSYRTLLLGAGSLYRILSPTDSIFLLPGLYNNLTSTLLPVSVTISHSIQPLDGQGYILIFLDRIHLLFTQVHFLFWQLGLVGGKYITERISSFIVLPSSNWIDFGLSLVFTTKVIDWSKNYF